MVSLNLKSYLERIRYAGSTDVSLCTLDAITEAHTSSIPFENIDVILDRGIKLSDEAIFHKLVTLKRGGYCFEQNGLLLIFLTELGFDVKPISARVRLRFTNREETAPRTHMFLRVDLDGKSWLTDVGMGAASLTKALSLTPDIEQKTPHDTRRLNHVGSNWYHQIKYGDVWQDACEFTLEEMPFIDREIANWYTSKHPQSHFRDKIVAARALPGGNRITLQNFDFTLRSSDGEAMKTQLKDHEDLIRVLTADFGIVLTADDREGISAFFSSCS